MSLERNSVSLEEANIFMRLATSGAVVSQLQTVIQEESSALATWLKAALVQGHFDITSPVQVNKPDEIQSACRPATNTLWGMIKKIGVYGGNDVVLDDDNHNVNAWGKDERKLASHKPHVAPDVIVVLGEIADRIRDTANAPVEKMSRMQATASAPPYRSTRDRNLLVFLAIATAVDDVEFVKRIEAMMEPEKPGTAARFIPRSLVETSSSKLAEKTLSLHPGSVAVHFGANRVLEHHVSNGWQIAAHAGYQSQDVGDGSPGMLEMVGLLRHGNIRLQPSTLKRVYGLLEEDRLVHSDRIKIGELSSDLVAHAGSITEWERIVLDSGIGRADPSKTFYQAARVASVPVLQSLTDMVRWPEDFQSLGHPALMVIGGSGASLNVEEDAVGKTIDWFLQEADRRGPSAVEDLFKATNADACLAEELIRSDLLGRLHTMLEMGLDPERRVHGRSRSAIDAAVDHGKPAAESMIRAFQARQAAHEALDELGLGARP